MQRTEREKKAQLTSIRQDATAEQGATTDFKHLSWTSMLHTAERETGRHSSTENPKRSDRKKITFLPSQR